jgi:hypothetical protein
MDNLNILVEAKREYLEQLSILVCPVMIDVFDAMYQEACKLSKGRKVLIMFQQLLKDVPEWSETMAKQHTDNIADRCAWFKDLVAAVFVSSVKILSAVRLSKDTKQMSVKLPTNEVFIHTCYKNAAKDLYKDPYVFTENQSEHDRNDKLYERFSVCVETTVKELIPVQQILQTYMTTGGDEIVNPQDANLEADEIDEYEPERNDFPDESEPIQEEIPGDIEQSQPHQEQEMPHMDEQQVPEEREVQPPSDPFQDEFRTISAKPTPQEEESEDLFADAAETRTKKVGY